ncbi:MAG: restriction endonuclease [Ramlibacter sp.]|nr:restriction endonuclease [Ramlibacter sp.]
MLPWWVGVALALVSYVILQQLAAAPAVVAGKSGQMAEVMTRSIMSGFASVGQFIVPIFCILGAIGSFIRRKKRAALVSGVTESKGADALNGMSWREFELLVGEAFRLQGYSVTELGGAGADGGVDLVLRKGNEKFLVQCKQWKAFKVGVDIVRQLYGVMAAQGAAGGFVITSGTFTADAKSFAEGRNVTLVDGPKLFGLLQQAKSTGKVGPAPAPAAAAPIPRQEATAQRAVLANLAYFAQESFIPATRLNTGLPSA